MRKLWVAVLFFLVGCGVNQIDAVFEYPTNAVLLRVHPANMGVRHFDSGCPDAVRGTLGNYGLFPPSGGQVAWKIWVNLSPGLHCFFVSEADAALVGVEPLAFEVFLTADEYAAPEEAWIVGIPLGGNNGSE